jgi:sporulation protein YlmC with PRC-barrel domain
MQMKRAAPIAAVVIGSCLLTMSAALAAPTASSANDAAVVMPAATPKPAEKCLGDVKAFRAEMSKGGYCLGGSDEGYGYPMGGYGYGYGMLGDQRGGGTIGYGSARPGYELRTLISSATILAQMGKQRACEAVLATTRTVYQHYTADLHGRGMTSVDQSGWQARQIAAAVPVTGKDMSFRPDQLLDSNVVSPGGETLGSVDDTVTDPKTGKIAYLIISRGGLFGIDASYVPVPWDDFKVSPNASLLVLDTSKAVMSAAPQMSDETFTKAGQFDAERQKVDAYWKSHVKATVATN